MKYLKILKILCISLMLTGCAGYGEIRKYDIVEGERVLTSVTEFEGRNIIAKDGDAGMETKSWTLPSLPVIF